MRKNKLFVPLISHYSRKQSPNRATMGIVRVVLVGCLIAPIWSARVRVTGSCKCDCPVNKNAETMNVILMERDMGECKLAFYPCLRN